MIQILKPLAKIAALILAAFLAGLVVMYYRHGTIFPQKDQPTSPEFIIHGLRQRLLVE